MPQGDQNARQRIGAAASTLAPTGVCSAGFESTALPAASGKAAILVSSDSGAFVSSVQVMENTKKPAAKKGTRKKSSTSRA